MSISAHLNSAASLRYRVDIIRGDSVAHALPWREHMITDAGLEALASNFGPALIVVPSVGDAATPTPVRRDGGTITFSQAADVISTDGAVSFFVAADVGRLFKFSAGTDGAECYISEFISASSVRVDMSATITSQVGVVWYVNTAALLQPITGLTWTAVSGDAYNYTQGTMLGDVVTITHQTVRVSSVFSAAKTITEIAFSSSATNANVFDRDAIQPGAGILAGDQARVTVQLIYKVTGVTQATVASFGVGCDTAGTSALVSVGIGGYRNGFAGFNTDGTVRTDQASLDPCASFAQHNVKLITASGFAIPGFSLDAPGSLAGVTKQSVPLAYVSGSHVRDCTATFTTAEGVGTVYGFAHCSWGSDLFVHKLNTPFVKTNEQTLDITFRKSFRRLLNN